MVLKQRFAALTLLLTAVSAAPAYADTWTVDADQSRLGFEVKQGDSILKGVFGTWTADIEFDPDAPGSAAISATVNPASASTGNPQFDGTLTSKDWFDVSAFPDAVFEADGATLVEGSSYRTKGTLSIKGLSHPVDLDFTLEIDGDTATAKGTATLSRLDYKLGTGVGTDTVGDAVTVTLDLTATR
ncbi:YceI family protein [Roseibium sp. Sym1]|uniref:YceI family protein n=1 Tax=Roseibium sp. Sym1 TaxID=3016006 RepID=UPI0022B54773|nr:YceI family protein [Roseibium sp. Sym1]